MKKHIVFLSEHLTLGGAEVVLTQYIQYIDRDKYKVSLILRNDLEGENYLLERVPADVKVIKIFSKSEIQYFDNVPRDKSYKSKWQRRGRRIEQKTMLLERFEKAFEELNPDVVIDFSPVLNRYRSHFKKYKFILWMHGEKSHMGFLERSKYLIRMSRYEKIVLICQEMRSQFVKLFPALSKDKFTVIYNPFDFERIRKMAFDLSEITEADKELLAGKYVVSVGRLVPGKDFRTIIEAARILKTNGFSYCHYILGAGELAEDLQKLIVEYDLQGTVQMLGPKKNPYPWIKNSQLFVHSAIREGLPTVVIESMILGVPVIASACPTGPREILLDGRAGGLYEVGDSKKLAELMEDVLINKDKANSYLATAEKRIVEFHKDSVIPSLYKIIDEL